MNRPENRIIPHRRSESKSKTCDGCALFMGAAAPAFGSTEGSNPMPTAHPRPWHRDSRFGDGPRRPLDREQRARFRFLLNAHRRAGHLTPHAEMVGDALV